MKICPFNETSFFAWFSVFEYFWSTGIRLRVKKSEHLQISEIFEFRRHFPYVSFIFEYFQCTGFDNWGVKKCETLQTL